MFRNQLKIAIRNLIRQKGYTFINISGLAIGIACCILIVLYINDELSYDRYNEKADRIYRIGTHGIIGPSEFEGAISPAPMAETFVREFPEIVTAVRFRNFGFPVIRYKDKVFSEERFFWADSTIFDVFTIPFLKGDPKTALTQPNSVVITKSIAQKYFGDEDPMGKMLNSDNRRDYMVTGVINDFPSNSHLHLDFIGSLLTYQNTLNNIWVSNNFYTYVVFREGYSVTEFEAKIPDLVKKYAAPQIQELTGISYEQMVAGGSFYGWFLQPITDIHLYSDLEHELEPNGNAAYVLIFALIAAAILIIACINFMNLATARSANRAREVGMRKTLGSTRTQLIRQFLTESIFLTSMAVILALIVVEFVMPYYNLVTGKQLAMTYADRILTVPVLILLTIFVGVLAGSYPAFFLASFQPVEVLTGKIKKAGKGRSFTRSGLVIFQFTISIALIAGTIIVFNQLKYIQDKNLGFNKEQIIIIEKTDDIGNQLDAFKYELKKNPAIMAVNNSTHYLGQNMSSNAFSGSGPGNNQTHIIWNLWSDYNFVSTYEIEMAEGRFYSKEFKTDSFAVVMNESAVEVFGFTDPVGKEVIQIGPTRERSRTLKIIGVMKDFHFESLHQKIRPMMVLPLGRGGFGRYVSVRIAPENIGETIQHMEGIWHKFAGNQAFEFVFFDQEFARLYASEERQPK